MVSNEVLAAATSKPVTLGVAGIAGIAAVLVLAVVVTVVLLRRKQGRHTSAPQLTASSPAAGAEAPAVLQNRLRNLAADIDMAMETSPAQRPQATASRKALAGVLVREPAPAPVPAPPAPAPEAPITPAAAPAPRTADDATRFFGTGSGDEDVTLGTVSADAPSDATRYFGPEEGAALLSPSQTRYFSPSELGDQLDAFDLSIDSIGQTGMLQALPPKREEPVAGADTRPADTHPADTRPEATPQAAKSAAQPGNGGLDGVAACLDAITAPEVLALSVIDGEGRVLAGAADEDIAGELRALLTESGRGTQADVVQPLRFADDSRGAVFLLPTGADALLGALVREDDLQETRTYLRGVAGKVGEALRAAS